MINLLLLNNFYPVTSLPTSSKRMRRIVVYGLVTRYGPQSVAGASGQEINSYIELQLIPQRIKKKTRKKIEEARLDGLKCIIHF